MGKYDKIKLPQEDIRNLIRLEFIELYEDKKDTHAALDVVLVHTCFTKILKEYTLSISELEIILDELSKSPSSGILRNKHGEYRGEQ